MKNVRRRWVAFAAMLAILLATGCFHRYKIDVGTPVPAGLGRYETVLVYATTLVPQSTVEVRELEMKIFEQLQGKRIFHEVFFGAPSPETDVDLCLNATITALSKANLAVTFFGLGRAYLTVEVSLVDTESGEIIGVFKAENKQANTTTGEAITNVAEAIANYVAENI